MDTAGLDGRLSLPDFQELLAEKTGVPASHQELLGGFPPAPISLPALSSSTLGDLPIANGDTIVVRRREVSTVAAASVATTADDQPAQQTAEQRAQVSHWYMDGNVRGSCESCACVLLAKQHYLL